MQHRLLSSLLQEMARRQIDAMPFLISMLINHGLEYNEQISVKYFVGFAYFPSHKMQLYFTYFLECQNSADV